MAIGTEVHHRIANDLSAEDAAEAAIAPEGLARPRDRARRVGQTTVEALPQARRRRQM